MFKTKSLVIVGIILMALIFGFIGGAVFSLVYPDYQAQKLSFKPVENNQEYSPQTSQEEKIISAVNEFSEAVVSIIISKDLPVLEEYWVSPFEEFLGPQLQIPQYRENGTERKEVGGGTGFFISSDGLLVTNRHVVADVDANYTVLANDGQKYEARVLARDPVQDLAVLQVEGGNGNFKTVNLGDSSRLQIGQTVIAIGNALGEFKNTVSVGVVSGLGRTVVASSGKGETETLDNVIQTDTAINRGNSGGPLLNLKGEVIGISTAIATNAENIGFAIPINQVKKAIEQVRSIGKIVYPFLGVRYVMVNDAIAKENNLDVNYGAWITPGGQTGPSVIQGSAAQKAGLLENDIILELEGEKITADNSLANIILNYNAGDSVTLKILRGGEEITVNVILGEMNE